MGFFFCKTGRGGEYKLGFFLLQKLEEEEEKMGFFLFQNLEEEEDQNCRKKGNNNKNRQVQNPSYKEKRKNPCSDGTSGDRNLLQGERNGGRRKPGGRRRRRRREESVSPQSCDHCCHIFLVRDILLGPFIQQQQEEEEENSWFQ